jgi:Transposase DDE domain
METNKSALQLMLRAYEVGQRIWPDYSSRYSRQEFTQPQLFACLAVRESLKLSYRRAEVFLRDVPDWLAKIDLNHAPDHNTLWRAFGKLLKKSRIAKALDLLAEDATQLGKELARKPLSIDSTCYEPRHRSKHYDRVCRRMQREQKAKREKPPGKWGKSVNASRSRKIRAMPKLALAVAAASHRILAAKATLGNGSDAPDFKPLLSESRRRGRVRTAVADAGYDSEKNHEIARYEMKVRSIIPPKIGRPTSKPPEGRFRRLMKQRFARRADARHYGQRSQSETVNSMMKRNLGEYLRSIRKPRRKQELLLKAVVHNIMLREGGD